MAHKKKTPILEFRDLTKRYPLKKGGELTVLDNMNRTINEGDFITLVGPSGCGKSTLFNLILGALEPTSGAVLIDGNPVMGPGADRGIVYQRYSLYPHLSVLENVMLGGTLSRMPFASVFSGEARAAVAADKERALEYLDRVSLRASAFKRPDQLSGGMQQRVAIAQALFTKPRILLMDEPFGALDSGTRHDAQLFLLELWEKFGLTVIFVTHSIEEAIYMGTHVYGLSQHYEHPDGSHHVGNGSKIVIEADMRAHIARRHAENMTFDYYVSKFTGLLSRITQEVMDPNVRQHMDEFRTGDPADFSGVIEWDDAVLEESTS